MSYKLEHLPGVAKKLGDFEKSCAITVALKISDDSCKMDFYEKSVFMGLYESLIKGPTDFFSSEVFELIDRAREKPDAKIFAEVKVLRESAMDMITRPKMKAFKASIRARIS